MLRLLLSISCLTAGLLDAANVIDVRPREHATPLQDAIRALPDDGSYTLIRLAPGVYREKIFVPKGTPPFKLLGESAESTRLIWSDTAKTLDEQGRPLGTFRSSTIIIESNDFSAENVSFENAHGPGVQAVALSIGGDRGVFRHCRFLGWQDTLLVRKKRHYFDRCHIAGSVDFIDQQRRQRASKDLAAGIDCLLAAQVVVNNEPTVWCAQHDPLRLRPSGARMQEPASLSSSESAAALLFLMKHAPNEKKSIAAGLDWFERSKLTGIARQKRDGRNYYDEQADSKDFWWGRFHDLRNNRPIFSGAKDGRLYHRFAELFQSNPTEYQYYTTQGRSLLLKDGPRWRTRTD